MAEEEPMPEPTAPPSSWIVIHVNASGKMFATRVTAPHEQAAADTLVAEHVGNRYVHVFPDTGEAAILYNDEPFKVTALGDEP